MKLNNKTPSIVKNDADVLLPSHASAEVPTKVVHDAFTFYSPVGYQRQYFADDRILNEAAEQLDTDLATWSVFSTQSRRFEVRADKAAMERFARTFQSQSWPKKVHALIPALAAAFTLETKALAGWSKTSVSTKSSLYVSFETLDANRKIVQERVRAALSLPPY